MTARMFFTFQSAVHLCDYFTFTCLVFVVAVLDDMQSAIKVATCKLGLQPGAAFQARVAQLAELVKAHKLVSFMKVRKKTA